MTIVQSPKSKSMKILDRYLLQEYTRALLFCLFAFVFIFITVDLFEDIAKFIDKKVGLFTLYRFYFFQIPSITVLIIPVASLLSCFFSVFSGKAIYFETLLIIFS